ncbi:MAG: DUF421 domain-containing protein [Candidatus Cohnella colombiensis]|uniref:DUF421 domain-containing protein n=1 Tax=Candidatus Cohnella colombiensis TaxID=3121368 RepID=A0AA95EZ42_9BACL|nr:MAG: DUF421 domain-containing protein [Cohnella sp.]
MFALEALSIIISGFILFRIAGKKVIAEMTPLEMVTTLAVGTIIGHAVSDNTLWKTIVTIAIFVAMLIVFQTVALKWRLFQTIIIGNPTLVIMNGVILTQNLSKLRMTTEQLEMRIRQVGISHISDIHCATIEVNGQLGYELAQSAKPLTHGELKQLLKQLSVDLPDIEQKSHNVFEKLNKG